MNVFRPWQLLLVTLAGWINHQQQDVIAYIREANRVLKNQLKGKQFRFTDDERRRLAVKGKILGRNPLRQFASIVAPDTILARHLNLIARKWDYSKRRWTGSPAREGGGAKLTVRMAKQNPNRGYTAIMGELANFGHIVARKTVRNILKEHGIDLPPNVVHLLCTS